MPAGVGSIFYFIHDAVYNGNAYTAFFTNADVLQNIGLFVGGLGKGGTVIRNFEQKLFIYPENGKLHEFIIVFMVGVDNEVRAYFINGQHNLIQGYF